MGFTRVYRRTTKYFSDDYERNNENVKTRKRVFSVRRCVERARFENRTLRTKQGGYAVENE